MREEWKTMNFETLPHKDSGTYLVKGIDEVQTLLDDHIVKTQAIRGSPFCKPFEKECREWEQKLSYIQEALDQVPLHALFTFTHYFGLLLSSHALPNYRNARLVSPRVPLQLCETLSS